MERNSVACPLFQSGTEGSASKNCGSCINYDIEHKGLPCKVHAELIEWSKTYFKYLKAF
ncbi:hypothetical protein D3C74_55160 [compost metagenome]